MAGEWDFKAPAFSSIPDSDFTRGGFVGRLCERVGLKPDPEQQWLLDAIFGVKGGKSSAYETCVIAPRQQLKTGFAKMCALGWLFLADVPTVTWSAQEFGTALEAFNDLAFIIERTPFLLRQMAHDPQHGIHGSKGFEHFELANGHVLKFKARTKHGARGLTGDKIILDEAYALKNDQLGALLPTLTAVSDPQILYLSSAGMISSDPLRSKRDQGRSGADPRLAYAEWCAPYKPCVRLFDGRWVQDLDCEHSRPGEPGWHEGCAFDDEELWAEAMPLLGRQRPSGTGLTLEKLRDFRRSEPPSEWRRERLGWWDDPGAAEVFGVGNWDACTGVIEPGEELRSIGVAVSVDLSHSAIVGATGSREHPKVRVLQSGPGTDWVLKRLVSLRREFPRVGMVIDPKGPGASLVRDIAIWDRDNRDKISPVLPALSDLENACAEVYRSVVEHRFIHEDDAELTAAAEGVVKRPIQDRWLWGRSQSSVDISPLEAATWAVWNLDDQKPVSVYESRGVISI